METITITLPDSLSIEQVELIKQSTLGQIEAEIRKTAVIPLAEINRIKAEVAVIREIIQPVVEVREKIV